MNNNEKRWIILLVAVVIIAIIFFVVITNINKGKDEGQNNITQQQSVQNNNNEQFTTELDDGTKVNTSEEFGKAKTYEDWISPKLVDNIDEILEKEIPKYRDKIESLHLSFTTDPFMYEYEDIADASVKIIKKTTVPLRFTRIIPAPFS